VRARPAGLGRLVGTLHGHDGLAASSEGKLNGSRNSGNPRSYPKTLVSQTLGPSSGALPGLDGRSKIVDNCGPRSPWNLFSGHAPRDFSTR
jgi:hypothetical protein